MKHPIPEAALAQHIAVVGKTGSGKTSTEKLAVEQVVAANFRVCVLDTIKSDWWGITSSADGKRAGLPFKILGGPRGHVPLHSSAGKVIGQLVGSGKLPLSIIDMADFEAGGIQRFFIDFAPALMRHARGVIYLVIEEAHEIAPKERSGIGAENMAIHWAKKLATAGRSKGIRLIVATQRTQSLHNAVLGSCETVIAHRLTTPADQEPVIKWLKANVDKETQEKVASSLSSLPTGTGWICSGEARIFEKVEFPKFKTYDNTATPTGDSTEIAVKTAHVDQDELRAIIGDAVKEAEANDPKVLRAEIAKLKADAAKPVAKETVVDQAAIRAAEQAAHHDGRKVGKIDGYAEAIDDFRATQGALVKSVDALQTSIGSVARTVAGIDVWVLKLEERQEELKKDKSDPPRVSVAERPMRPTPNAGRPHPGSTTNHRSVTTPQQRILDALAWMETLSKFRTAKDALAFLADASPDSSSYANNLGALRSTGMVEYPEPGSVALTDQGRHTANPPEATPTHSAIMAKIAAKITPAQWRIVEEAARRYPNDVSKEDLADAIGASPTSSSYANNLGRCRTLGLITYPRAGSVRAADVLFP